MKRLLYNVLRVIGALGGYYTSPSYDRANAEAGMATPHSRGRARRWLLILAGVIVVLVVLVQLFVD